nr:immunoglobulin-like domain-containing protein [Pseudomonas monteilii]
MITYTVTLSNPAQTPVTVTLSNGQTITVEAGKTQAALISRRLRTTFTTTARPSASPSKTPLAATSSN